MYMLLHIIWQFEIWDNSSNRNACVFIFDSEITLISKNGFTCNIYRNLEQVGHYLDRIHNSERGVWPLPITRYTRLISHTRFVLDFLFTQQWAGYRLSCHYLTQRSLPWPLKPWQPFGPHCPLRGSHGVSCLSQYIKQLGPLQDIHISVFRKLLLDNIYGMQ